MPETLQEAIGLHQKGEWVAAETAYRGILQREPRNPDALALLGAVLSERKLHNEAIKTIQAAIELDPQAPLFHFHLGNAFDKAGRHAEAESAFAIATAITPQWAQAWYNLGNAQRAQNKNDAAASSYERVLKLEPGYALAHNNMALLLLKKGDAPAARARIEEGLKHQPTNAALVLSLNDIAMEQNDLPTAFSSARKLAEVKLGIPANDVSYLSTPGFFRNRDEESYNALLALATSTLLQAVATSSPVQSRFEEASAILRGILAEEPDMEEAFLNLGTLALARNKLDMSEECCAQSFMLDPSNSAAPWNRSMAQLTKGDIREGLRRYRWRWHALERHKNIQLPRPLWNGENLNGKTLLIHEEQGFGDSMQMLRFVPQLKAMGARVYFYAQAPLYPLLENWKLLDQVSVWDLKSKNVPPEVDYVCGVMDLPGLLNIGLHNIPAQVPYLPNPRANDTAYKLEGIKPRIGLVWAGNPAHKRDHERSVPFEKFHSIMQSFDADFYSFQHKPKESDQKQFAALGIIDLAPRIKNIADMAGFMAQLDLLITIDSAPAHLAGGLGVPTFLLITHNPDWRWLLNRGDSPWYPTLQLFRQPKAGDWEGALIALKNALAAEIAPKAY